MSRALPSQILSPSLTALRAKLAAPPEVALVLGSGLGAAVDSLADAVSVAYSELPDMPTSGVDGHAGRFVSGTLSGRRVLAMQGRVHMYEGYAADQVVSGVRLMLMLGARTLIVTNAAGGIRSDLRSGDLMLIEDHLNLTGTNCLIGPNDPALGTRFPDLTSAYDPQLIHRAAEVAERIGLYVPRGVYAGLLGPNYETPAEIRMLRTLGADAVGMSTVLEVIAANHMGARVLGISCITNLAAGLSPTKLSHADVESTARASRDRFTRLLAGVLEDLPA
jgi:purine-nucleoside phosphorylase